jgi:uncharacterized protein
MIDPLQKKRVAIIGASPERMKYGNRAVRGFLAAGYEVFPINPKYEIIEGIKCFSSIEALPQKPDIVSVYTPPVVSEKLIPAIAQSGAAEVYFNPGSENDKVKELATQYKIPAIFACSIVARAFFTD